MKNEYQDEAEIAYTSEGRIDMITLPSDRTYMPPEMRPEPEEDKVNSSKRLTVGGLAPILVAFV